MAICFIGSLLMLRVIPTKVFSLTAVSSATWRGAVLPISYDFSSTATNHI